jgi:copper chaperone CopZ
MFEFLRKKKISTEKKEFHIGGMHCVACSLTIDSELEDIPGVVGSNTSYAKGSTVVAYDPKKVSEKVLKEKIAELGYTAQSAK